MGKTAIHVLIIVVGVGAAFGPATLHASQCTDATGRGVNTSGGGEGSTVVASERLDFRSASLDRCDFSNRELAGSRFDDARLDDVEFYATNLRGGSFVNAVISSSDMTRARLEGANFADAKIDLTFFMDANLADANLTDVHATRLYAERADFSRATLDRLSAERAKFGNVPVCVETRLSGAA